MTGDRLLDFAESGDDVRSYWIVCWWRQKNKTPSHLGLFNYLKGKLLGKNLSSLGLVELLLGRENTHVKPSVVGCLIGVRLSIPMLCITWHCFIAVVLLGSMRSWREEAFFIKPLSCLENLLANPIVYHRKISLAKTLLCKCNMLLIIRETCSAFNCC